MTAVSGPNRPKASGATLELSPEHYLQLILRRKWLVVAIFLAVSLATAIVSYRLPNIYTSETVILVDPQKVPENYVKPTVTGDIHNRLGTLSQQILSATRLQKIIDSLNLYANERKTTAREDVITKMRADINVKMVTNAGASQDLLAFRVSYSGKDPRLVAQVTNELAALFIEENLKAREQQATGTTEFLENQLEETRKTLEEQEGKLKDFKMKHLGEMPEHQAADLQILGQLQSQFQLHADALKAAEQRKAYLESMMTASAPVIDLDADDSSQGVGPESGPPRNNTAAKGPAATPGVDPLTAAKARLATLLQRYTDRHPEVVRVKNQIADLEASRPAATPAPPPQPAGPVVKASVPATPAEPAVQPMLRKKSYVNPVLQAQLQAVDEEIATHNQERERLSKQIATYTAKLESIPIREQEITGLVRDYEISKNHYSQLLDKQLSAQTATQLEIRQKGERFSVLDPAQPADRPSSPNRMLINLAGSAAGFVLGLICAIGSQLLAPSISTPDHIRECSGVPVLEVIPLIVTNVDQVRKKKHMILAAASGLMATVAFCAILLYHYHYR